MKDNFSAQSNVYAAYRPSYPQELFDFILSFVANKETAWDCATGNGQTAKELAKYFKKIFATDISQKQLDNAVQKENVFYSLQPAEKTDFADNSFDLITVSQSLHWFDFDKFYAEAKRVSSPGAIIAVWTYDLMNISKEIDELVLDFYKNIVGPYWDAERKWVEEHYQTIPFPFKEIKSPVFKIESEWSIDNLTGYLNSWSATQKYIKQNGTNPVDMIIEKVGSLWGNDRRKIVYPVYMRMGHIEK